MTSIIIIIIIIITFTIIIIIIIVPASPFLPTWMGNSRMGQENHWPSSLPPSHLNTSGETRPGDHSGKRLALLHRKGNPWAGFLRILVLAPTVMA
jgi:hypothetical protein